VELEKDSAPFEDQLLEAAKFIGIDLDEISRSAAQNLDSEEESSIPFCHGREEWLLRWLLKRLQTQKDDVPR
jgi:nucleolar pre-ribosomal-associated protein 2